MKTPFWSPFISDGTVKAICWTLIHSLWIGLVVALLCAIVIAATRKSAATLRYRLLCGLLVLFVAAIGVTYFLEADSAPASPVSAIAPATAINFQHSIVINHAAIPQNQTFLENLQAFLNQNANMIVLVWLLFFLLKSLKMVSGLLYIQRIRHYKTSDVTEELKHKIELFSSRIGIGRAVRLVQSELVKVPVAVGWLKPMILLPVGIAFQLTPEQLDGILWHELAHIRRRDYLVNILQGLVETVFFFNPGLLWLSSLIRAEREACCDDMVLSRMNRKANYLEALLSFGYGEFSQARYAMSIGSGNQLRDRLKRMISQENKRLSIAEKSVLAVGLLMLTVFTTVSKDNPIIRHLTIRYSNQSGKVVTKTMTDTIAVSVYSLPKGRRVNDLKPDSREKHVIILTDTAVRFVSVLFKQTDSSLVNNDFRAMDDKGNKYHFVTANGKLVGMEMNGTKISDSDLPGYEYMVRNIGAVLATKKRVREGLWVATAKGEKEWTPKPVRNGIDAKKYGRQKDSVKAMNPTAWKLMKMEAMHQRRVDSVKAAKPEPRMMKIKAMRQRAQQEDTAYVKQVQRCNNIIADLVKAGVVTNAADVKWFGLSNSEFMVNGQKQSDEMQQRYKAKYGVSDGNGLYYGPVQMHGVGVFIDATPSNERMQGLPPQPKAAPRPNYKGSIRPRDTDPAEWKNQQLIRQQQLFAADEAKKRQKLIRQQQAFATEQDEKRGQLLQQQQGLLKEQNERMKQRWLNHGIDLQPAISGVITDLVSANVISDKSQLSSFNLSNKALIVNGKKQAEDIHEKLKSKYLDQSAYPENGDFMDWDRIKNDPNFGLHFDTNGNQGLGILKQGNSQ